MLRRCLMRIYGMPHFGDWRIYINAQINLFLLIFVFFLSTTLPRSFLLPEFQLLSYSINLLHTAWLANLPKPS